MNTSEKKFGVIKVWHEDRGFGFIREVGAVLRRYFFHINEIESAPADIKAGMKVFFRVSQRPPRIPGGLLSAIDVEVCFDAPAQTQSSSSVVL